MLALKHYLNSFSVAVLLTTGSALACSAVLPTLALAKDADAKEAPNAASVEALANSAKDISADKADETPVLQASAPANASQKVSVSQIMAYRDQVLTAQEIERDLANMEALLATREAPKLDDAEFVKKLDALRTARTEIELERAEIQTALNAVGGVNPELESDLARVLDDLQEHNRAIETLGSDYENAKVYWEAEKALEAQAAALTVEKDKAFEMLETASNKPVTDDVMAEINRLLGL